MQQQMVDGGWWWRNGHLQLAMRAFAEARLCTFELVREQDETTTVTASKEVVRSAECRVQTKYKPGLGRRELWGTDCNQQQKEDCSRWTTRVDCSLSKTTIWVLPVLCTSEPNEDRERGRMR
jgi:hypothetical protein